MAEYGMTLDEATEVAFENATTSGLGTPIAEDAAVEETPAEPAAEPVAAKAEETPAEDVAESELVAKLTELTHKDVIQTKAGKGLTAELQRERQKRHELEAELEKLRSKPAQAAVVEEEPEADPLDGLADDDLVEAKHVRKLVAAELAKAEAARQAITGKAERSQAMATGLAALKADKSIPAGVNVAAIVNKAIADLQEADPAQLDLLMSKPNPVEAVWKYSQAFMPEVQQAVAKASKAKAETEAERLARGRSPDTGDEPADMETLLADLNAGLMS